jgi:hypothetical protein
MTVDSNNDSNGKEHRLVASTGDSAWCFRVLDGDGVRGWRLDGFGQVPGMAGREWLELEAEGVLSPYEQRVVLVVAPTGA